MKVFYENGNLTVKGFLQIKKLDNELDKTLAYVRSSGRKRDTFMFDEIAEANRPVYTNSLIALDNKYCWNDKTGECELYLRGRDGRWHHCDKLTKNKVCKEHNLMHRVLSGAFQ